MCKTDNRIAIEFDFVIRLICISITYLIDGQLVNKHAVTVPGIYLGCVVKDPPKRLISDN